MDDHRITRRMRRQAELRRVLASRPGPRDSGTPAYLGEVYDGGHLPKQAGAYFLTHPATLGDPEREGGAATPTVDGTRNQAVYVPGTRAPAAGELLLARLVDSGRWVAETSSGDGGTTFCPCREFPTQLTWTGSSSILFPADDGAFGELRTGQFTATGLSTTFTYGPPPVAEPLVAGPNIYGFLVGVPTSHWILPPMGWFAPPFSASGGSNLPAGTQLYLMLSVVVCIVVVNIFVKIPLPGGGVPNSCKLSSYLLIGGGGPGHDQPFAPASYVSTGPTLNGGKLVSPCGSVNITHWRADANGDVSNGAVTLVGNTSGGSVKLNNSFSAGNPTLAYLVDPCS